MAHVLSVRFQTAINVLNEVRVEQFMAQRRIDARSLNVDRSMSLVGLEGTQMFEHLRAAVRDRLLRALHVDEKANAEIATTRRT